MLKKIPVSQLRLGMHLHALEGPWLNHPFWRTRFVLDSPADLQRLQDSEVRECLIDPALGLDVAMSEAHVAQAAPAVWPAQARQAEPGPPAQPLVSTSEPRPASLTLADELQQAAAICNQGRTAVMSMFNEARLGRTIDAERCMPLVEEITASVWRNPGALVSLARLKTKDDYSFMHSVAVCALMVALARQLGKNEDTCRQAGLAGLVHDVGKAVMPLDVLNKPGPLNDAEFDMIRRHPERGRALLVDGLGATPDMLDVVLHHHERMDGTGYPNRLAGEQISKLVRMGSICDVYDAITSHRPYKRAWDPAESMARMASWKGHFDSSLFGAFVRSLGIYPTGSVVRLKSQRLAVVVEQNGKNLVAPMVRAFYSIRSEMPIPPQLIDLSRSDCNDSVVGREQGAHARFPRIDELWADPAAMRQGRS